MCFGSQSEKIRKKENILSRQGSSLFSDRSSTKTRRGGGSGRDEWAEGEKKGKLSKWALPHLHNSLYLRKFELLSSLPNINPITVGNNA